ncbi:actin-2-like [Pteropus vampyrus]|uniref:Actin-2-like n=1 Tax=Pteropus vampyrus TaxID=132908 RepID=A0A6P3RLV0_PTEVA|nr:actin-2-like [Pteropus vampyrus]
MSLPLVCDYGSGFSKVGFSGAEAPLAVFPTILGKLRHDNPLVGTEKQDWFIGDEAQNRRDRLSMLCPISRATVTSWDNMEKIWHHSFYQVLRIAPEQHPMMVTDPPLNAASNKEKVLQLQRQALPNEGFDEPAKHAARLLHLAQTAGADAPPRVDGPSRTWAIAMLREDPEPAAWEPQSLLREHQVPSDREYIRDMKEKCCYVALDFDKEQAQANSPSCTQKYQLPDGREISLGPERFFCPEALFHTDLIGRNSLGIHMTAFRSISSCNPALWKVLFRHVLLSGGTGSCLGLRFRMQRELSALVSPLINVKASSSGLETQGPDRSQRRRDLEERVKGTSATASPGIWLQSEWPPPSALFTGYCEQQYWPPPARSIRGSLRRSPSRRKRGV